jgi:ComF family protein
MIKKFLLNLFFPKKCLGCGQTDTYLCPACFNKIEIIPKYQEQSYLDQVISATDYKNPLIQELIKKFKYHYIKELAKPLSQLLIKSLAQCWTLDLPAGRQGFQHNTIVLPIPLYKIRERTRGFNQAELLAKEIAKYLNLSLETNILKRTVSTIPQVNVKDHEKRKANIKDVFEIHPSSLTRLRGANIILVDDVSTTGATLSEAGKVLKKSGIKQVWALVVARG